MDLLTTALVDITTIVATCHALKSSPAEGELAVPRKLRSRLSHDIKRGTVAYIDALARTRRGMVDVLAGEPIVEREEAKEAHPKPLSRTRNI